MKNLIFALLITLSFEASFAGGSGSGSMDDGAKGGTGGNNKRSYAQILNPDVLKKIQNTNSGIVYYQGETHKDIYFKMGQPNGSKWMIEQYKVQKNTSSVGSSIYDALVQSKETNDWEKIQKPSFDPY